MKKFLGIVALSLLSCSISIASSFDFVSANRSESEIKNGVFLEDVEAFGTFEKINTAPLGMFETKHNQFVKMSKYSQGKIGLIFVQQKGMLDKFPENLMLGMGYFEFFYMQQLKDHKKDIIAFKKNTQILVGQKLI